MKYDELANMVTGSSVGDWARLEDGPFYLDQLGEVSSGEQHWIEVDSHLYVAVYRPNVSLRLAWGLGVGDRDLSFEGMTWPDRSITRHLADAFWDGSLVARWTYLVVDGGRSYLPDPKGEYVETTGTRLPYELTRWTAKASEIALARLLSSLAGHDRDEFGRYLEQSGIVEIPD